MQELEGRIAEIRLDEHGSSSALITGSFRRPVGPGEYLLAWSPEDPLAATPRVFFPAWLQPGGFWTAEPAPYWWSPGMPLRLQGPFGRGFRLPANARRLALGAYGSTAARLFPLLTDALQQGLDVTLFTDCRLPALPPSLEIIPLSGLWDHLDWPDFLALDLPGEALEGVVAQLGSRPTGGQTCPVQALVTLPMPCAGLADCGACAVPIGRAFRLACKDGPVFDLPFHPLG